MRENRHVAARQGIVLVAVVVVFAISLTLFGVWGRAALQQHRRAQNEQFRWQAVRLAEAGLRRAVARRAADPQYEAEIWQVSAGELNAAQAAEVRIRVVGGGETPTLRYEATAEFPVGALRRAQITKRIQTASRPRGEES